MYHVEIGNYRVLDGEHLPTKDLTDNYQILWDSSGTQAYTVIMMDVDAPYPDKPANAPYLHLMLVNVRNGKGNTLFDYISPSPPPDSEAHRYEIYLFRQSCLFYPKIKDRANFDLRELLTYESSVGCPMHLVDKLTFYGDPNVDDVLSNSPDAKNFFSEYYEANNLSDEDYRILGDLYGVEDAFSLSPSTIKAKINKILSYKN